MHPLENRHPSTTHMLTQLQANPNLPDGLPKRIALDAQDWAEDLASQIVDGPELTAGLRKLLEAKDCLVRASLDLEPVDYRDR